MRGSSFTGVIRVLTLTQPWAWAVVHGGKTIENRTWSTTYRGPFLIHASKAMSRRQYEDAREFIEGVWGVDRDDLPAHDSEELHLGCMVGRARIVGIASRHEPVYPVGYDERWHMKAQNGFLLAGIEAVEPKPWRGALGLVRVDLEPVEALWPGTREWAMRSS